MQFEGNITIDDHISREGLLDEFAALAIKCHNALRSKSLIEDAAGEMERAHRRFIEVVAEEFHREASNNNLCEAYDRAVDRINETLADEGFDTIPPRKKFHEVEVVFSGRLPRVRHTIRVEATSLGDAQNIVRTAAMNGDVNSLLYEDGEFPHDTVDAVLTSGAQDEFFQDVEVEVLT